MFIPYVWLCDWWMDGRVMCGDVGQDRVGESGDAAEELAHKVRVGFCIDVVCPMVGDLEHGLKHPVRYRTTTCYGGKCGGIHDSH